jgi:hypothetical protein
LELRAELHAQLLDRERSAEEEHSRWLELENQAQEDRRERERLAEELPTQIEHKAVEILAQQREHRLEDERQVCQDHKHHLQVLERKTEEERQDRERQASQERRAWDQVMEEQRSWREERERLYSELRDAQHISSVAQKISKKMEEVATPQVESKEALSPLRPEPQVPSQTTSSASAAENPAHLKSPQRVSSLEMSAAVRIDSIPTFGGRDGTANAGLVLDSCSLGGAPSAVEPGAELTKLKKGIKAAMEAMVRVESHKDIASAIPQGGAVSPVEGNFTTPVEASSQAAEPEEAQLPEKLGVEESRRLVKSELEKLRQWYRIAK